MTKLVAFYMLRNAEKHLIHLVPYPRWVSDYPDIAAACETLRRLSNELARELRGILRRPDGSYHSVRVLE